jgi:hypothetical protein
MQYQVDGTRLLLPRAAGVGHVRRDRVVQPSPPSTLRLSRPSVIPMRGMLAMTLLGLASGLVGGTAEDATAETAHVSALHAIYSLCRAPVFVTSRLA